MQIKTKRPDIMLCCAIVVFYLCVVVHVVFVKVCVVFACRSLPFTSVPFISLYSFLNCLVHK